MHYRRVGDVPRKRHTQHRTPDGTLYTEEGVGIEGFGSDWALLYHRHSPSAIVAATDLPDHGRELEDNQPLRHRHLRTAQLPAGGDMVHGRRLLLGNDDVMVSHVRARGTSPLFRNGIGHELIHVASGSAVLESTYGSLAVHPGDYVVVPTATIHRWVVDDADTLTALVVESRGHIGPPARYLTERGQFTEQSPFCERDLRAPEEPLLLDGHEVEVVTRHRNGLTRHVYAHHPFDVVGWDGALYPYAFNIADFEPITGRLHQPPPVHQTFAGQQFVVCSFVPRKLDYHPLAIPVPYHHANVDSDEVLFYTEGEFGSRRGSGIGIGSITLHPAGLTHGPQPGAVEAALGQDAAQETAVMVDTFRPLRVAASAAEIEDADYAWSWARPADA